MIDNDNNYWVLTQKYRIFIDNRKNVYYGSPAKSSSPENIPQLNFYLKKNCIR